MDIDFDKMIDNYLKREYKRKEIGKYRPSEVVNCLRKVWFSYVSPKEISKERVRIFEAGNMLHDFIAKVLKSERNPEVELLMNEVPIEIKKSDFIISGRIDDLILIRIGDRRALVEVKSCKELPHSPRIANIQQIQLYMYGKEIREGYLLYVEKNTLKTKAFKINYNENIVNELMEKFEILHRCLKDNVPPVPEGKIFKNLNYLCKNCEWKDECDNLGR
jgi:CRISPR-associated exonuclease Cas4